MKNWILVSVFALSSFGAQAGLIDYICYSGKNGQTLLLQKLSGEIEVPAGTTEPVEGMALYRLEIQTTELPFPSLVATGMGTIYDVNFSFVSLDGNVRASAWTDDEDEEFSVTTEALSSKPVNLTFGECGPLY